MLGVSSRVNSRRQCYYTCCHSTSAWLRYWLVPWRMQGLEGYRVGAKSFYLCKRRQKNLPNGVNGLLPVVFFLLNKFHWILKASAMFDLAQFFICPKKLWGISLSSIHVIVYVIECLAWLSNGISFQNHNCVRKCTTRID